MIDAIEALKAELAAITARVAAFERARVEEKGPPKVPDEKLAAMHRGYGFCLMDCEIAVNRLRYCERELARLLEGLKVQEDDMPDRDVSGYADRPEKEARCEAQYYRNVCVNMAKEIQRHRALLKDGGGK